ncbi:MAG: membrane dipeptidase [Firmicutes bacterium]|nr:membrane dipeptidase [Bacillota bacterium]
MVFDLHNDLLTAPKKRFARRFDKNVIYAVWTTQLENPIKFIRDALQSPPTYAAVEDLGFLSDCVDFLADGDFAADGAAGADLLARLKPVYASLTWNGENALAGGAHSDAGLSDNGRKMIKYLESAGILLDAAHLSRRAFFEAAEASAQPMICSHTCFDGLYAHRRNLTDTQIKTIIGAGGLIGLCLVSEFMGKAQAGMEDVIRQIDYFTQRFGCKNLALGTDLNGCEKPAIRGYAGFVRLREELLKRGYTRVDVNRIFYQNARCFLKRRGLFRKK